MISNTKAGIIQSSYLPWRGFFDFISTVDVFIFHDDIQYTKNDWRNRNKIKAEDDIKWLTMPVKKDKVNKTIANTFLVNEKYWKKKHLRVIGHYYRNCSYKEILNQLISDSLDIEHKTISELNIYLIKRICKYLKIDTTILNSNELKVEGQKTEKIINLLKKIKADTYLSGPRADSYLDKELFVRNNINLEYKSYKYKQYPQLGSSFINNLSIIDLIANCGEKSIDFIKSQEENIKII